MPAITMSQDFVELNKQVSEAKDASGKVELMFIEERAERRQAVNDLWEKLRELQNDVRTRKKEEAEQPQIKPLDREAMMKGSVEISRIEKELATHRAQMQELRFQIEGASKPSFGSPEPSAVPNVEGSNVAGDLEKRQQELENEVASLRDLWVEVQLGLSMCAVRASRIAMRTSDLSEKGRKQALSVLESKEQAIMTQIEDARKARGLSRAAEVMLVDPLEEISPAQGGEISQTRGEDGGHETHHIS